MAFQKTALFLRHLSFKHNMMILALTLPLVVQAGEPTTFDIGAQPLASALRAFTDQSHKDLLYSTEQVEGLHTKGIQGTFQPTKALDMLLAGSGISVERHGDAYLLVQPKASQKQGREKLDGELLPTITVTATRTRRDLLNVPASVSIVTAEEMDRQHLTKPEDALRTVPGLDLVYIGGNASASIPILRGLGQSFAGTTTQSLLNGVPVEPLSITRRYLWYMVDPSTIERMEVVRGPSSVLYGPNAMGGVINVITKRGRGEPFAEVTAGAGSHNAHSLSVAAGGSAGDLDVFISASRNQTDGNKPLTETPAPWSAWYPAGYTDLDGRDSESLKLNTRLTWWLKDTTDLSLGIYHFDNDGAVLGGHPNYRIKQKGTVIDTAFTHQFSGGQQLKTKLTLSEVSAPKRTYDDITWGGTNLDLVLWDKEDEDSVAADIQLDLHPLPDNTLTLGGSWWQGQFSTTEYDPANSVTWEAQNKSRTYGIFIQDEHRFDRLTLTLGGRYDVYKHYDYQSNGAGIPDADDSVFTPRFGFSYQFQEGLSLYGSAGTAYIPAPNSLKYRASPFWLSNPGLKPETATSYELGLKFRSVDGLVEGSAAAYHTLYKDKISVMTVGTQRQFQNLGETQVRGVELDLRSHPGDYWQPFANYTYTDSEITHSPSDPTLEGNQTANTPKHKFNVGLLYDNPQWITAQATGRYVGERYFQDNNEDNTRVKSHFLVDLKLSKTLKSDPGGEWSTSLSVDNIFDEEAYGFWYEKLDGRNYWLELTARF